MTEGLTELQEDIILAGLDDWIGFWEVGQRALEFGSEAGGSAEALSLSAIEGLLRTGLVEAGDLTQEGCFEAWSLHPQEVFKRVKRDWEALGRLPEIGEIGWLSNTSAGDQCAQLIATQKGSR